MSSHSCIICLFPIYRVISDYVHEYVCLNMTCINFKYSVPEYNTVRNVSPQLEESFQSDYPIHPLLDEHECPAPTAIQFCVAQPFPHQALQQGPIAVPQPARASGVNRVKPRNARRTNVSAGKSAPILGKPLSELPSSKGPDPLGEIAKYAQRGVQVRLKEAEEAGRVKRPSNKFLLYRKAYNSSVRREDMRAASAIIGQSWAMEGDELREHFAWLANTDAMLHEAAFPSYQYTPRRPVNNEEPEDLEELDFDE
ncbi:hypothetical protein SLS64_011545 [Diaporthe eres]|uniref:HMG box domain-containing protein n=1 Tax=Diaporthe eres TaxID=83184 RepID=A0ABR1P053_DIAER